MPLTLSPTIIAEKNKLATDSVFLYAMMVTIPGDPSDTILRVVRNNEDIVWDGETWQAFPFEVDDVQSSGKGEIPRVDVRICNISRAMEAYVIAYDTYVKANGFSPIEVELYVLNTLDLASSTPAGQVSFELKQPKMDAKWATFTLGAPNPYNRRFPQDRILKNHCRFRFKDALCGYSGAATECDKTLTTCRLLSNSARYGGFPGVGYGGFRFD
jgi:lambda family phage minor tail protein L